MRTFSPEDSDTKSLAPLGAAIAHACGGRPSTARVCLLLPVLVSCGTLAFFLCLPYTSRSNSSWERGRQWKPRKRDSP